MAEGFLLKAVRIHHMAGRAKYFAVQYIHSYDSVLADSGFVQD